MYYHHIWTLSSKWRERIKCITLCNVCPVIKFLEWELPLYGIICAFKKDLHKTCKEQLPVLAAARQKYFSTQFLFVPGQVKFRRTHSRQNCEVSEVLLLFVFDFQLNWTSFIATSFSSCRNIEPCCVPHSLWHKILVFNRRGPFRTKFWTLNSAWSRFESHF